MSSVVRGRFCELLGRELGLGEQDQDLFLMGLFSLIDALTGRPLDEALTGLPLIDPARAALPGARNRLRMILDLVQSYERAQWSVAERLIAELQLGPDTMPGAYLEAVNWGRRVRLIR